MTGVFVVEIVDGEKRHTRRGQLIYQIRSLISRDIELSQFRSSVKWWSSASWTGYCRVSPNFYISQGFIYLLSSFIFLDLDGFYIVWLLTEKYSATSLSLECIGSALISTPFYISSCHFRLPCPPQHHQQVVLADGFVRDLFSRCRHLGVRPDFC